jgi:hypothetical protein
MKMKETMSIDTMTVSNELQKTLWQIPIPIDLIRDLRLSAMALRLYCDLLGYARAITTCFPSRETLSRDIGVSVRQVDRLKNELKALGILSWKQKKNKERRLSNIYTLDIYRPIVRKDSSVSGIGTPVSSNQGHKCPDNNTNSNNTKNNTTIRREELKQLETVNPKPLVHDVKLSKDQKAFVDRYKIEWKEKFKSKYPRDDFNVITKIRDINEAAKYIPTIFKVGSVDKWIRDSDHSLTVFVQALKSGKLQSFYPNTMDSYRESEQRQIEVEKNGGWPIN